MTILVCADIVAYFDSCFAFGGDNTDNYFYCAADESVCTVGSHMNWAGMHAEIWNY